MEVPIMVETTTFPNVEQTSSTSQDQGQNIIKVSSNSRSTAVAGAIAGVIRERREAVVQAIGASAVNQAVKAMAIARTYLEEDGLDIWCQPSFVDIEIDGQERTALRFRVVSVPREQTTPPTNVSS